MGCSIRNEAFWDALIYGNPHMATLKDVHVMIFLGGMWVTLGLKVILYWHWPYCNIFNMTWTYGFPGFHFGPTHCGATRGVRRLEIPTSWIQLDSGINIYHESCWSHFDVNALTMISSRCWTSRLFFALQVLPEASCSSMKKRVARRFDGIGVPKKMEHLGAILASAWRIMGHGPRKVSLRLAL